MCGQRRAACCGGAYSAGNHYSQRHGGRSLVLDLIEGVQQMRLASQQQTLAAASAPVAASPFAPQAAGFERQTQGTIYPMIDGDEKTMPRQDDVNYEVLPTYEEAAAVEKSGARDAGAITARSNEAPYVPRSIELPNNANRSLVSSGLNEFNIALASYKEGGCGGKCRARRAAKNLVKELARQEVARLEATHGPLVCGQRKQIRRDLEPVKDMLKAAVREARREQAC